MDEVDKMAEEISRMFEENSFSRVDGLSDLNEDQYNPTEGEIRNILLYLNVEKKELRPCPADNNIAFWLERISMWGKLKLYYIDEAGRKKDVDKSAFLRIYNSQELPKSAAKWQIDRPTFFICTMTREYQGYNGQHLKEILVADVSEPKPEYKNVAKGLKILGT